MKAKIKDLETMLREKYPEKTDTAIRIMLMGWEHGKVELLKRIQGKENVDEILQIIQEFK